MQAGLRCRQVVLLGKEEENYSSSLWLPGEHQVLWGPSRDPDTAPQQARIALNLQKQQNAPRADEGKENGDRLVLASVSLLDCFLSAVSWRNTWEGTGIFG